MRHFYRIHSHVYIYTYTKINVDSYVVYFILFNISLLSCMSDVLRRMLAFFNECNQKKNRVLNIKNVMTPMVDR